MISDMNSYSSLYPYTLDAGPSSDTVKDDQQQPAWLSSENRHSVGRFDDASDDERAPSLNLSSAMSSFHPPPPRDAYPSGPTPHHIIPASTSASSLSAERRLPASLSSTLRGKRAPAPAALDLSPRSERVKAEAERHAEQGGTRVRSKLHSASTSLTPSASLDRYRYPLMYHFDRPRGPFTCPTSPPHPSRPSGMGACRTLSSPT